MKLSADPNSEFYNADMIGRHTRVLLNGVEMKSVTFADEDEGYIICCKKNEGGTLVVDWGGDCIVTERLEGRVQIIDTRTA